MNPSSWARTAVALTGIVAVFGLQACASTQRDRVTTAVSAPLSDFNIIQTKIPKVLLDAKENPYQAPVDRRCASLQSKIYELDVALGPDLDAPPNAANPGLIERGGDIAESFAVDSLQRTAESLVPFRSWVRKLSGAERHSRLVASAIAAGSIQRAFLKGLRATQSCMR